MVERHTKGSQMKVQLHNKPILKERRKSLRNNATKAEKLLWKILKSSMLEGRKFRRQHSIGNYIVDFYCPAERLVLEIDGDVHDVDFVKEHDKFREEHLKDIDFNVLRIRNEEIFEDMDKVMAKIRAQFSTTR